MMKMTRGRAHLGKIKGASEGYIEFSLSVRHLSGGAVEWTIAYTMLEFRKEAFAGENMNVV